MKLRGLRIVGQYSQFAVVAEYILGNIAAQRSLYGNLDHGMSAAVFGQHGKEIQSRELIRGDRQPALLQLAQFEQGLVRTLAQIQQLLCVVKKYASYIGETALAGGAVEKRFADFIFQLADSLTYCRLGTVQFFCGAGKPAFLRDRHENFQL